jgi:hypothetical protein
LPLAALTVALETGAKEEEEEEEGNPCGARELLVVRMGAGETPPLPIWLGTLSVARGVFVVIGWGVSVMGVVACIAFAPSEAGLEKGGCRGYGKCVCEYGVYVCVNIQRGNVITKTRYFAPEYIHTHEHTHIIVIHTYLSTEPPLARQCPVHHGQRLHLTTLVPSGCVGAGVAVR